MSSKIISIGTLDDLYRCINLASNLELSGWPKIGNIHRTKDFSSTRYEQFLAGIAAIQPNFITFCKNIYDKINNIDEDFGLINMGLFFKQSAEKMMEWQKGGNVILGHILILAPLVAATTICLRTGNKTFEEFEDLIHKIIKDSTVEDTINLYKAIHVCNPGGLGKIENYDLNDEHSLIQLERDNINLLKIFELSQSYDLISREYANNFKIILREGLPYFINTFKDLGDLNIAIVNTYLMLLSTHNDTLIMRKSGKNSAEYVSSLANKILKYGGISTKKGLKLANKYDNILQKHNGALNPGTTADLISGVLFCALIFGIRF